GRGRRRGRCALRCGRGGRRSRGPGTGRTRARGVRADPEHIVISAGISNGLRLIGTALRARGAHTIAVESYGLPAHWQLLDGAGLRTRPLPFDERGTNPEQLTDEPAVLVTPAHQFPMGLPLRHDRQPIGALQGLDPDHVVYLGTASKSLAPGLRLAWLILPPSLAEEVSKAKGAVDTCGVLDQLTLAEFITSGAHDRHVRAARLRYRRRRDNLVEALARHAPDVHVTGIAAGFHAVLSLPPGTEQSVVQAAAWQGLALHPLSSYRHDQAQVDPLDALVVGYGTPSDHAWAGAVEALCRVLP
ncbi:PLP-dependent aminotransferase family protein, partial [Streptomyces sp. MBT53]|uniref:aminotransferase-like domain-containing protein n=1 Tax=Streptomyces sp. MBT53 TaxID=1488384 RepID=UPI0035ABA40B